MLIVQALVLAHLANKDHGMNRKSIEYSTFGIIFLGTPHQGSPKATWAEVLTHVISITYVTNSTIVKHLHAHSEWLEDQIRDYKAISGNFDTKFCFESYPTQLKSGVSLTVCVSCFRFHKR